MRHNSPTNRLSPATDRAVERLTQPHSDTHAGHVTEWPPLIDWIERAITEQVKRGGASSGDGDAGIDEGALRIFNRIKYGVASIAKRLYLPKDGAHPRVALPGVWEAAHSYRVNGELDDELWEHVTEQIESWVADIEAEWEDRPSRMELTVPCPDCGHRWIVERADPNDPGAQDKRRPAVIVEYASGRAPVAECRVLDCGGHWVGWEQVAALGSDLGAAQNLEVLEACGISLPGLRQTVGDTL